MRRLVVHLKSRALTESRSQSPYGGVLCSSPIARFSSLGGLRLADRLRFMRSRSRLKMWIQRLHRRNPLGSRLPGKRGGCRLCGFDGSRPSRRRCPCRSWTRQRTAVGSRISRMTSPRRDGRLGSTVGSRRHGCLVVPSQAAVLTVTVRRRSCWSSFLEGASGALGVIRLVGEARRETAPQYCAQGRGDDQGTYRDACFRVTDWWRAHLTARTHTLGSRAPTPR